MSFPFILWTLRHTGGDGLVGVLAAMSESGSAGHEVRDVITVTGDDGTGDGTRDAPAWSMRLEALVSERAPIRHRYDAHPLAVTLEVVDALTRADRYRHVLLRRRDEASRLFSHFVAQATGAGTDEAWWRPTPLPIEDVVGAYQHGQRSTEAVRRAIEAANRDVIEIYLEDLWLEDLWLEALWGMEALRDGSPADGLSGLDRLLDFLDFSPETVSAHRAALDAAIVTERHHARAVARFVPNAREIGAALVAAGWMCPPGGVAAWAAGTGWGGPQARMAAMFRELACKHDAHGPFLEIGVTPGATSLLASDFFAGSERHLLCADPSVSVDGVVVHPGTPADLPALFGDGRFGTVLSNGALASDRAFLNTVREMKRVLMPGGLLMVAVSGFSKRADQAEAQAVGPKGNPIPNTTVTPAILSGPDYWRLSPQAIRQVILDGLDNRDVRDIMMPPRLFGVGTKPRATAVGSLPPEPESRRPAPPAGLSLAVPDADLIGAGAQEPHPDLVDHLFMLRALILRDLRVRHLDNPLGLASELARPSIVMVAHYFFFLAVRSTMPAHIPVETYVIAGFSVWFAFNTSYYAAIDAARWPTGATLIPGVTPMHLRLARASWMLLFYLVLCLLAVLPLRLYGDDLQVPDLPLTVLIMTLAGTIGFGLGLVMERLILALPVIKVFEVILSWALFVSSGVYLAVATTPSIMDSVILYNPLLHLIEYERHAFDPGYPVLFVTLLYPAAHAIGLLLIGLMTNRCLRHLPPG
jgi:capsular polysaccharide transport system permease protein